MAIELDKEVHNTGVICNYWRLSSVHVDPMTKIGRGAFSLYKDAAAFAAGKSPVGVTVTQHATGNLQPTTEWQQIEAAIQNAAVGAGGELEGGTIV